MEGEANRVQKALPTGRWATRLTAGVLAAMLSVGALSAASAVAQPGPSGTLTKTGSDAVTGSTTQVQAGNNIDWVLNAANTSGVPADVRITDPIGANQTYVPGSLNVPPGYTGTAPTPGDNQVTVTGNDVPNGSTATSGPIQASQAFTATGAGDGTYVIFFGDNVYNIPHHRGGRR